MSLAAGAHLGPYEIVAPIGAGGMGEVYRARDTRLDRQVALKVSQHEFTDRFEREARTISALNHPNICQLYDVGPNYLVMELIDGAPIAPVDQPRRLLDLAIQIADGLAAAHAAGVVHRDLKPDNILVTREGRVKILDFGLAKLSRETPGAQNDVTMAAVTDPGTVLGTVSYMSPEQARGEAALTPQSDQFSLGLVLYELAAGRRAFQRGSGAETMAAIIREDPEPLPVTVPAPLRWVIARLLAKDPAERYESTRDLHRELRQIRERLSELTGVSGVEAAAATAAPARPRRAWLPWAMLAGGLAAGVAVALGMTPTRSSTPDLAGHAFTPIAREVAPETMPAWSPDGQTMAYLQMMNGIPQVFTRGVGSPEAAQITRSAHATSNPRWSADGRSIYFGSNGSLWSVGSTGGAPERVIDNATGYALHPDGRTIVFGRGTHLWILRAGEEPRQWDVSGDFPTLPGQRTMIGFSPDGRRVAGLIGRELWVLPFPAGTPERFSLDAFAGSWMPDSRRLVITELLGETGASKLSVFDTRDSSRRVFHASQEAALYPAVSPDGRRGVRSRSGSTAHGPTRRAAGGRARTLLGRGGVSWFPTWAPSGTRYLYGTNHAGRWAVEETSVADGLSRRVLEVDAERGVMRTQWSPDGSRFTFVVTSGREPPRTMLAHASGGRMTPLDQDAAGATLNSVWSPDGETIVYTRNLPATRELQVARIRPGSTAAPEILATYPLDEPAVQRVPLAWAPGGREILAAPGDRRGLWLMSADYARERPLSSRTFANVAAGFSRDGRDVLGIARNTTGTGAEWELWALDAASGRERRLAALDLPGATDDLRGFSLHPDGTRFATSIALWPYDIWMLEGFEP